MVGQGPGAVRLEPIQLDGELAGKLVLLWEDLEDEVDRFLLGGGIICNFGGTIGGREDNDGLSQVHRGDAAEALAASCDGVPARFFHLFQLFFSLFLKDPKP